jgi:glutamate racemase
MVLPNSSQKSDLNQTIQYNISFGDSGVGGLIFACDAYEKIIDELKNIEANYYVKFNLHHIGDSINAPYDIKSVDEIKILSNNFINHMMGVFDSDIAIVACNTASTIFDHDYEQYLKDQFPNASIWPIIYDSALCLYDNAVISELSSGQKEIHIGLLATSATLHSGLYEKALREIHANRQDVEDVKMHTYMFSPTNWVENIENNVSSQIHKDDVKSDLKVMISNLPDSKNISSLGLFCTHFPFLQKEIEQFFVTNFNKDDFKIVTQGALFGGQIIRKITSEIDLNKITKREDFLDKKDLRQIPIFSNVTGNNIDKMELIIGNMYPEIADKVVFKKIDQNC